MCLGSCNGGKKNRNGLRWRARCSSIERRTRSGMMTTSSLSSSSVRLVSEYTELADDPGKGRGEAHSAKASPNTQAQEGRSQPFRRDFRCSRSTRSWRSPEIGGESHAPFAAFPCWETPAQHPRRSSNSLALDGKEARDRVWEAPRPRAPFPIRSRTPSHAGIPERRFPAGKCREP